MPESSYCDRSIDRTGLLLNRTEPDDPATSLQLVSEVVFVRKDPEDPC
jgi:hypothetical protein